MKLLFPLLRRKTTQPSQVNNIYVLSVNCLGYHLCKLYFHSISHSPPYKFLFRIMEVGNCVQFCSILSLVVNQVYLYQHLSWDLASIVDCNLGIVDRPRGINSLLLFVSHPQPKHQTLPSYRSINQKVIPEYSRVPNDLYGNRVGQGTLDVLPDRYFIKYQLPITLMITFKSLNLSE